MLRFCGWYLVILLLRQQDLLFTTRFIVNTNFNGYHKLLVTIQVGDQWWTLNSNQWFFDVIYKSNFGILSCMGKWVPRFNTRGAYPSFHIQFDSDLKYTKYLTRCRMLERQEVVKRSLFRQRASLVHGGRYDNSG